MKPGMLCRNGLVVLTVAFSMSLQVGVASAALIDSFSDGPISALTAPPLQFVDQSGLLEVIGSGDRNVQVQVYSGPGTVALDIHSAIPGEALLSSSVGTVGLWHFWYGTDSPMDVDLTDGAASNALVFDFGEADAGGLSISVIDTSGGVALFGTLFSALPGGGTVVAPFSLFSDNGIDPLADFTHVRGVFVDILGSSGGSYALQMIATPEPSTFALAALGIVGLFCAPRNAGFPNRRAA